MLRSVIKGLLREASMTLDDPIGVPVWLEETLDELDTITSTKVRGLGGLELYRAIKYIKESPRREKWFERVQWNEVDLEPAPVPDDSYPNIGDEEGFLFIDKNTGLKVVREDDGSMGREVPYPPGAVTLGDMAKLSALLWAASDRAVEAAEADQLTQEERQQAVKMVEAADDLEMFANLLTSVDKRKLFDVMVNQLKKRPEYRRSQMGVVGKEQKEEQKEE